MILVLVSGLILAACQPISVEQAEAQLCADMVHFKAAMGAVDALTKENTVDEAQAAMDVASDAWDNVAHSARVVNNAKWEEVDQAYNDLQDTVREIDEGESIEDAVTSIQAQVADLNTAYDQFYDVQCVK